LISNESRDSEQPQLIVDHLDIAVDRMIYNNAIIEIPRDSKGAIALPRVPTRSKSEKCSNCAYCAFNTRSKKICSTTMHRFYIREGFGWKAIGWYCKNCGSIVLDELKLSAYIPTITVLVRV